jgi:hypothetical protein
VGLETNGLRALFYARRLGADFMHTATIGRQTLLVSASELRKINASFSAPLSDQQISDATSVGPSPIYSEALLSSLGAIEAHSFDKSDYEGATHVWDLNDALPSNLHEKYTLVIDGGTLEHVFNFPVAIANCMNMLVPGGHYVGITPANSFFGHGFYQFSPELFFSIFTEANGFSLVFMAAFEDRPFAPWFRVTSPAVLGERITLRGARPLYLVVVAKKIATRPVFHETPQQSDYVAAWDRGRDPSPSPAPDRVRAIWRRWAPSSVKVVADIVLGRRRPRAAGQPGVSGPLQRPGFDPRFFQPFDPTAS